MAQFNLNITQGSAPYTISIKAFGDNTERWISGGVSGSGTVVFNGLTGNNNYNVSVSSNGCTTGYNTFSMNCVVPTVPNSCSLSIANVIVFCNSYNNGTVTVNVNNPDNYILEYQIDNYITWQTGNVFNNITNTGTGYTIRVRNKNNIQCEVHQNTVYVDCITPNPTPVTPVVPTPVPNSPTPSSPVPSVPTPVTPTPSVPTPAPVNNCNLSITGVNVTCLGDNNGTVTVNISNPNGYTLQYQIDGYINWQNSNVFNNITNTGTGYTVRVRDANNTSCEAVQNTVYVDCHSVPTPVTPTPTPISPTPVPSVPSPTPVGCNGITNLTIYGSNAVTPNSQNSYTSSYSGDAPYSYLWNISGQGTSVIGANNGDTATFQFGSSNGTITLTVTNCGGTYSVDFPFSQSGGVVINSCDVVFNGNSSPDIYKYDVATDTVSVIGTTIGSSDIAMTDTKLWVYGSDIIYEYNITKNPFTINFNRNISFNSGSFGAGLVAINDTTLVTGANTIRRLDISGSTAVETSLFDLPSGSIVTGDIVYKSSTDTYIITYHNNVNRFVGEFSPTGTVLKSGVIGISAAYGIIAVSGSIYLCNVNGDLYLLNESNYTISFAKNIGSNISGFSIAGATQSNGCY